MRSREEILGPWLVPHASRPALALLALTLAGIYLLMHPYQGMVHDARLYALQALNHLHPDLYGNDVFLRYGSQDDYTLFSPVYAWVISLLGVEPAAALLTLVCHLGFLSAAALLAKTLLPPAWTLGALILLLLLPDHYGPSLIFSYLEDFMTPRLPAEALVLAGLAAWLRGWGKISIAALGCAMLIHPIIGLAGVATVGSMTALIPCWRRLWPLGAFALVGAAALAAAGSIPPSWLLDSQWRETLRGSANHVSLLYWSADDWGRAATVATTLLIAARVLTGMLQRLVLATLVSTVVLMLVTLVGGDLLHIVLIVQAQPWRVLWLATVVAVLAMPAIAAQCWPREGRRRLILLLLAAAWLSPIQALSLILASLAILGMGLSQHDIGDRHCRTLHLGGWLLFSAVLLHGLALAVLSVRADTYNIAVAPWLDMLRGAAGGGTLLVAVTASACWLVTRAPLSIPAVTAIVLLLVASAAWPTAATWLDSRFDPALRTAFEPWREIIPPGSDVLWAADRAIGPNAAISSWLLLERPSYMSRDQAAVALFSREAALEFQRRSQSMFGLLPDIASLYPGKAQPVVPDPIILAPVCRAISARYIVSQADFVDAAPVKAPANVRAPFRHLKLYTCP